MERKEAKLAGAKRYSTGRPCKHGHIAERSTANGCCLACVLLKKSAADRKYREAHIEALRAWDRARSKNPNRSWRLQDQDKRKQVKKRFYEKHKEQLKAGFAAYRKDNAAHRKAYFVLYKKENAVRVAAWNAARRAAKIQRTPAWLAEDDFWMMEQAYELAAIRTNLFGFVWHVDHILPLYGKAVSGLHVPTNLQVIPALHNLAKGNRFAVGV